MFTLLKAVSDCTLVYKLIIAADFTAFNDCSQIKSDYGAVWELHLYPTQTFSYVRNMPVMKKKK